MGLFTSTGMPMTHPLAPISSQSVLASQGPLTGVPQIGRPLALGLGAAASSPPWPCRRLSPSDACRG